MFDYSFIVFVLPAVILSMYAQFKVSSTFNSYSRITNGKGLAGFEVADMLLQKAGIRDVRIERISGKLADHYDPRTKTLRLSEDVYGSKSIAAIGVAAHEVGHAIQHDEGYMPLLARNAFVPIANIASKTAMPLIFLGILFSYAADLGFFIVEFGIILFSAVVIFQVITLPVEFNASKRALLMTEDMEILSENEIKGAKKVLSAAALTYVAAAAVAIGNLIRLVTVFGRRN